MQATQNAKLKNEHEVNFYAVLTEDEPTLAGVCPRVFTSHRKASDVLEKYIDAGFTTACIKEVSLPAWSLITDQVPADRTIMVREMAV